MLGSRYGICGNPHTGYPDHTYMQQTKLGWLRALVLDMGTWQTMCAQVPSGTNVAAVITGQSLSLGNDFWSNGWRQRFIDDVTAFCEQSYKNVRLIEWTNEWDTWSNSDRAEKAAEIAAIGTDICKKYGILGVLGSVAGADWKAELARSIARINQMEAALGYRVIHGFAFHPYASRVHRDSDVEGNSGFDLPNTDWPRICYKVREAIEIAGGRACAVTEVGIKLGDVGGIFNQETYVHGLFEDELGCLTSSELLMATYFCWTDQNGAPSERGDSAFGLIAEDGSQRPAYRAFSYQMAHAPIVDMPVAALLASSMPQEAPTDTGGTEVPSDDETPPQPNVGGNVLTLEAAHQTRWQAIVHNAPYHHDFGFETAWRQPANAWWGSPITESEKTLDDGTNRALRIFANAVVVYNSDGTTEVL